MESRDQQNPDGDPIKPRVFISHRHADSEIAEKVRSFIRATTAGAVEVFSSSYEGSGPTIGSILSDDLGRELDQSDVVILIFTVADEDWSYCMWETGVAFNPRDLNTRIVVLQCGEDVPAPLSDRVRVRIEKENVTSFVKQFLTGEDFFPRQKRPVTGFSPDSAEVTSAAERLFEDLKSVASVEPDESWAVWPSIRFSIDLNKVDEVKKAVKEKREPDADVLISEHCTISSDDGRVAALFGVPNLNKLYTFDDMVSRWKAKYERSDALWVQSLLKQIKSACCWEYPTDNWEVMEEADGRSFSLPIMHNVCWSSVKGHMIIDFQFVRVNIDGKIAKRLSANLKS